MSSSVAPPHDLTPPSPSTGFLLGIGQVTWTTILTMTLLGSAGVAGALMGLAISYRDLPDVRSLATYAPNETTYIYDINGKLLTGLHEEENRQVVSLDKISPHLKLSVLAIEDSNFYQHDGINPLGILRAALTNYQVGQTVQGASTLSMQLVKNLYLTPDRTLSRKLAEAVLALRIEQLLSKDELLELYLNQVYWGHNTYGVETAAHSYFNKSAEQLTLGESAMMAGIIQAPESYSPFVDFDVAKERQNIVLKRLLELQWITPAEAQAARTEKISLGEITSFQRSQAPDVTNTVVQELTQRFGREALVRGGLRVQTTLDWKMQQVAEQTIRRHHQYYAYAADQMALVAVDPRTHFIKAIVGGVDSKTSEFNRATQAYRQPGSAFKPFVYYTAFATGQYTPDSIIQDSPVSFNDGGLERYQPQNYDRTFRGSMSIRQALAQSRNVPAIVLGQKVGIKNVIDVSRKLGITSPIPNVISLPLGAVDLTPVEMASAYATFANNGWQSPTTAILQVTDRSGKVLIDNTPQPKLALNQWAAASVNSTLQTVVQSGTGVAAQIGRPAAGKTGTTSSERDVWFVGYVPQLSVAVWAGNDNYSRIGAGATGGGWMAPVWREFMSEVLKDTPVQYFEPPSKFPKPKA